jgi:Short C-terminal domain
MLFLYRPRETWMPYALPRDRTEQDQYNRQLQEQYASSRRVRPSSPSDAATDSVTALTQLGALHRNGDLTDDEFAAEKAKVLGRDDQR